MQKPAGKKGQRAKSDQSPGKKKLPPKSKRERRRYILFESIEPVPFGKLKRLVEGGISGECHARVVKYFPEKKRGILRCKRGTEKQVKPALEALKLRSVRCSGCVKGLRQSI